MIWMLSVGNKFSERQCRISVAPLTIISIACLISIDIFLNKYAFIKIKGYIYGEKRRIQKLLTMLKIPYSYFINSNRYEILKENFKLSQGSRRQNYVCNII